MAMGAPMIVRILRGLSVRCQDFAKSWWRRIGFYGGIRHLRLVGYTLGPIFGTFAVVNLAYDLNVRLLTSVHLPLLSFFRLSLLPFINHPLTWVGIDASASYHSLTGVAAIGAGIWANAEFRSNRYLILHPFPNIQRPPGYLEMDLKRVFAQPWPPTAPSLLSFRSVLRVPHALILTYSLLGILFTIAGIAVGSYFIYRFIKEFLVFVWGLALWCVQEALRPFERIDDDHHVGTRAFLSAYRMRQRIDEKLEAWRDPDILLPKEFGSIRPVVRVVVFESGVVCALILVVVGLLLATGLVQFSLMPSVV